VTAAIVGPNTIEQLDQIFPGYRTAPDDYAW
jgi:hypothetical protein